MLVVRRRYCLGLASKMLYNTELTADRTYQNAFTDFLSIRKIDLLEAIKESVYVRKYKMA